jgi:hypothetical protein
VLGRGDGPIDSRDASVTDEPAAARYDDPVIDPRRRAAVPLLSILAIGLAFMVVACGPGVAVPGPSASRNASAPAPRLTAVPGGPASPVVGATVGPPTTTDTEFGTIDDALPPSFPRLPGQEPAETSSGPTSGSFVANTTVAAATAVIRTGLTAQGWTVDVGSPLEDGSVVLEARGTKAGCKAEVRFTPLSGTVTMSVLYGASCPFG